MKKAKPVDIDKKIAESIINYLWIRIQNKVPSLQDPWKFLALYNDLKWYMDLNRFLDDRFVASLQLVLKIGPQESDVPHVIDAEFQGEKQVIFIETTFLIKEQILNPP